MQPNIRTISFLAAMALAGPAGADTIGFAAPLSGPSAVLGAQMLAGAEAAAANLSPTGIELHIADDGCTAQGGVKAAEQFVAEKAAIVTGFLCTDAIEAALPILKAAGIPVITPGVRTDSLTDRKQKTGWLVYRVAPRADAERTAVASLLTRLWRQELFALVDDGTIYGREMVETFRASAEQAALKPVFVDTFRPQLDNQIGLVGRLRRAGATRVFAGGDRDDIAIMTRDAAQLNAGIVFAGGEALRSAANDVPLAAGTLMVGLPEWADIADPTAIAVISGRGVIPEGYVLPGYAAVEVAAAALSARHDRPTEPTAASLDRASFDTAIGTIEFDAKGDLADNPYRLFRYDGVLFQPVETD